MLNSLNVNEKIFSDLWEGKKIEFGTGKFAPTTDGAIRVKFGENELLVTTVVDEKADESKDFLPLTIDFRESFSAGGKIGGGAFMKREGKPSESAIIYARLTDRPMRPMFPEGMINETTVTITPLAVGGDESLGVPAIIGASLATIAAGVPLEAPVGAVKIGYKDGNFIINPTHEEVENGLLDIVIAGSEDTITMVECGAKEVSTEILLQAFELAQKEIKKICKMQREFLEKLNIQQKEITINKPSEDLIAYLKSIISDDKLENFFPSDKKKFNKLFSEISNEVFEIVQQYIDDEENNLFTTTKVKGAIFKIVKDYIRSKILNKEERIDGRGLDEIRGLHTEVGSIPKVHGNGLFQRGETQVLANTTLGAPGDVLIVDTMEESEVEKRFIHHYNMPGFSTNEAKPTRFPSRREIGHGKLAEKALEYVIPSAEEFPYTIRVVSEVLSSNGSTSMGSVCAGTMSLMDGGVPIKAPVSGIAMGLVTDENLNHKILTDIQGLEDFTGDMDFKVAGTKNGITALQMDMKIKGLKLEIIKNAIEKANKGRDDILNFMLNTIDKPKEEISHEAPKIIKLKLSPTQIKEVIGPGGATINEITRNTGSKIDFKEDGTTLITAPNKKSGDEALKQIEEASRQPKVGDVVEGKITRVESYGVFVNLGKNKTGLCHVKNLGEGFVADPKVMFKEGDKMKVKVTSIDDDGKIQVRKEN